MDELLYSDAKVDCLTITPNGEEVIRIDHRGRLFWHKREVVTDDDFRAAMLDLVKHLLPCHDGPT